MHQIRLRLGLRPRPRWGSLQRSPRSPSWILGGLLLRGGRGREGKGREGKGRGERREGSGKEKGKGREGKREGRGKRYPCSDFTIWPLTILVSGVGWGSRYYRVLFGTAIPQVPRYLHGTMFQIFISNWYFFLFLFHFWLLSIFKCLLERNYSELVD